jgi:ketosteroid isomerase-like protein
VSEENVEIVRRQFELWNAGDLDEMMSTFDADVVVEAPEGWPEGAVTRGRDRWRQQAERLRDTWRDARVEVEEMRPTGRDGVVAQIRYVTSGSDPGVSFDTPMAVIFQLKDGKVTEARYFWDLAEALEAAG